MRHTLFLTIALIVATATARAVTFEDISRFPAELYLERTWQSSTSRPLRRSVAEHLSRGNGRILSKQEKAQIRQLSQQGLLADARQIFIKAQERAFAYYGPQDPPIQVLQSHDLFIPSAGSAHHTVLIRQAFIDGFVLQPLGAQALAIAVELHERDHVLFYQKLLREGFSRPVEKSYLLEDGTKLTLMTEGALVDPFLNWRVEGSAIATEWEWWQALDDKIRFEWLRQSHLPIASDLRLYELEKMGNGLELLDPKNMVWTISPPGQSRSDYIREQRAFRQYQLEHMVATSLSPSLALLINNPARPSHIPETAWRYFQEHTLKVAQFMQNLSCRQTFGESQQKISAAEVQVPAGFNPRSQSGAVD